MGYLKEHCLPLLVKSTDRHRSDWDDVIDGFVASNLIMRDKKGHRKARGQPGNAELVRAEADDMQQHFDKYTSALIRIIGSASVSNYIAMARFGLYRQWMYHFETWPESWSLDGAEASHNDNNVGVHKKSQCSRCCSCRSCQNGDSAQVGSFPSFPQRLKLGGSYTCQLTAVHTAAAPCM